VGTISRKYSKLLRDAKEEFYFRLIDGSEIKSLRDLADSLANMSDDAFYYHVDENKNDFGNWVRDVFEQESVYWWESSI